MAGSSSQYCNRSLPLTSARLPADTNVDSPIARRPADWSAARPRAPASEKNPARPLGGSASANVALSRISGAVLMTPRQFGPITRIPLARAVATSARSAARPAAPCSLNPPDMTTSPRTRLRAHSSITCATAGAGTASTARSMSSGTSLTVGDARTLATWLTSGCTG